MICTACGKPRDELDFAVLLGRHPGRDHDGDTCCLAPVCRTCRAADLCVVCRDEPAADGHSGRCRACRRAEAKRERAGA